MKNKIKRIGIVALKTAILMALTVAISAVCRFLFVDNMFGHKKAPRRRGKGMGDNLGLMRAR